MKKVSLLLIAMSLLFSGCVVYEPNRDEGMHRGDNRWHDRDRDGVPDRQDNRPNDPRRY